MYALQQGAPLKHTAWSSSIKNGARVICPGDGIGGAFMDDVLIRTMLHTDIHAVRREADQIAEAFSNAKTLTLVTGNDKLEIDITDIGGEPGCGFLWDPDKKDWKSSWTFLPPSQPGIIVPKGHGSGSVNVDGTLLYHPNYHEKPDSPLRLTYEEGYLTDISGDQLLSSRLRNWLDTLDDESAKYGPVHFNVGCNPNAVLSQSQEWERVYGSLTCGMGDFSMLGELWDMPKGFALNKSDVHWDWTVLQPTILLDGKILCQNGVFYLNQ